MVETVSEALEKYSDLKELINDSIKEIKEVIIDLRKDISFIKDKFSDSQIDIRTLCKEIEWSKQDRQTLRSELNRINDIVSKCPICSRQVDLEALQDKVSAASTKATIAITLLALLLVALISHLAIGSP